MEMRAVVGSSNIAAVGYDAESRDLVVAFRGGTRYRYQDVPPEVHEALLASESKGRYLALHVTRNAAYACAKVPPDPVEAAP